MRGVTLTELLTGIIIIAVVAGLGIPSAVALGDRLAVERQAAAVMEGYQRARLAALVSLQTARLTVRPDRTTVFLLSNHPGVPDSTLAWDRPGPSSDGVMLRSSPGPVTIGPSGIAIGVGNGRYVLERGRASRSLVASRLGRLRIDR
jgi:Tfp pilus assembly protein FimT